MKVAVLGAGRMGRRHIQIVQGLGLEVAGICDSSSEALHVAASELKIAAERCVFSPEELLAQRPDCVIVATTAPTHAEYSCRAAAAGVRYILCEKPLAVSLAECDRVLQTCRDRGVHLAVNHQMRFMEQYTEPRRMLNSQEFGGLTSIMVAAGNFGLAMNGTHYFEMFRYLTDEAATEACAWFSAAKVPNPRGPQYEDRAGCVRLVTASGRRFFLDCSADQGHGLRVLYTARFGQVVVDELTGSLSWACRKEQHRDAPTTRYGMPWDEGQCTIRPVDVLTPTRAVLEALLSGRGYPTGEEGRLAVATLVAATLSDERGHVPVALADAETQRERIFPWA